MTETELWLGKAELYEALCLAVRRFEHGLVALREGRGLTADAVAELREYSAGPVRALGARLRRLAVLPRYRLSAARLEAEHQHGKLYLAREDQLANSCLQRIDQALDTSMDVLRELLAQNRWQLVEQMLDWAVALHPQLGAVAALEAAGAARLAGIPAVGRRLLDFIPADKNWDYLSGPIRKVIVVERTLQASDNNLLPCAVPGAKSERREHAHPAIPYTIRCLASGPQGQLIVSGFTDDLKTGGVYVYDVRSESVRILIDDVVVTGLSFDPDGGHVVAVGLRGKISEGPCLVVLDLQGNIQRVVNLEALCYQGVRPHFIRIVGNAYYFRDYISKKIIKIDRHGEVLDGVCCDEQLSRSTRMSRLGSRPVVFLAGVSGYYDFDEASGVGKFYNLDMPGELLAITNDCETDDTYVASSIYPFAGNLGFRSRLCAIAKVNAYGEADLQWVFYSGIFSDMTLHRVDDDSRIFLATSNGLTSFRLRGAA